MNRTGWIRQIGQRIVGKTEGSGKERDKIIIRVHWLQTREGIENASLSILVTSFYLLLSLTDIKSLTHSMFRELTEELTEVKRACNGFQNILSSIQEEIRNLSGEGYRAGL